MMLQKSGQPSITTISSYDEVQTPRSSRSRVFPETEQQKHQVEGPKGPHLFRSSTANSFEVEAILTMSPITPKVPRPFDEPLRYTALRPPETRYRSQPFKFSHEDLKSTPLVDFTPEMVAQSMLDAGIEQVIAERFVENDINGAILITLKFEDLKELDIQSFGIRTKVWHKIQALRDSRPGSPRPATPIEDAPSKEVRKERRQEEGQVRRTKSKSKPRKPGREDVISPLESASIVGIEQVIPKPHNCSKGANCSKFKRQQRLIENFKKEHPFVDIGAGTIILAGDPGNPSTAKAIDPVEAMRPMSDAVPSVVASSDILGLDGIPPLQYLQEAVLRNVQTRDPQDNVRQFLNFQHQHNGAEASEVPPTPPFEIYPQAQAPHEGLRALPKLSIPGKQAPPRPPRSSMAQTPVNQVPPASVPTPQPTPQPDSFMPYRMDRADPLSPDLQTPTNVYRFGTPFSEMDVPLTAIPLGPVSRDISQSVPPDMNYRVAQPISQPPPPRTQSRASARRPSFPVMPSLNENMVTPITRTPPKPLSPKRIQQTTLVAPPRYNYPWSPAERSTFEHVIPPHSNSIPVREAAASAAQEGVTYQGTMKKRKTRMLRHEWHDGFFTLKGTRLAMHKDAYQIDRTLEYIDIDDYAIACSSLASSSKLSAAFRAMQISHNREKSDTVGAFSFQLIPQDKNASRLRKRESTMSTKGNSADGVNGTGKTHHFAVKSRDERIDWMRELMLAKALKQKGDGFEISVNGNMI
jgi:hypothetical protein